MPELPEVEIIRLGLAQKLTGQKIKTIEILNSKTFQGDPKKLQGKKVLNIWRRAKILGIDLSGGLSLLFHLKMSGQLILVREPKKERVIGGHPTQDMWEKLPNKSTRVIFEFGDGSELYFNDQRKFGWIKVMDNGQLKMDKLLSSLGPEPLEKEFRWQTLKLSLLKHKSWPVKAAIMDQSVVAGVGNIYASEACFLASLDPRTKVKDLTDQQIKRLYLGIVKALQAGIKHGGSTRVHFVNAEGKKGYFLDYAYVYGKNGDQCKKCNFMIEKTRIAGRGTYFCPNCQDSVQ